MKIVVLLAGALLLAQFHPANPPGGVTVNKPWLGNPAPGSPVATNTPFAVNGSPVPGTAAPGRQLVIGPGGTPTWGVTPSPAATGYNGPTPYPTPATPTPGPTFAPAPTAIAGLPSCVPGFLGNQYQVTDQDCSALVLLFGATPLSTAGTGCQIKVYCGGAATGTPTPSWKID